MEDAQGQTVSVVAENFAAVPGHNALWWNGTYQGVPAPQGDYLLVLSLNGETASAPVAIGPNAPYLTQLDADNTLATPDAPVTVTCYASEAGEIAVGLLQGENWVELTRMPVEEGWQTYVWQTDLYTLLGLEDGDASLTFRLIDAGGDESTEEHLALTLSGFSVPQPLPTEEPAAEISAEPDGQEEPDLLVEEVTEETRRIAGGAGSSRGTGGMYTKIIAAGQATREGITTAIIDGSTPENLYRLLEGEEIGTVFPARGGC